MEQKKMTEDQMYSFIDNIDRIELHEELRKIYIEKTQIGYPKYLKAVLITLIALGYESTWVNTEFRYLLEETYITPYSTENIIKLT